MEMTITDLTDRGFCSLSVAPALWTHPLSHSANVLCTLRLPYENQKNHNPSLLLLLCKFFFVS